MTQITIEKSTLPNTDNQIEISTVIQTIIVNNDMIGNSITNDE